MSELQEFYIRCILGAVFAITLLITAFHRVRAASTGERISRQHEGLVFAILLRFMGFLLFASTGAFLISPDRIRFSQLPVPIIVRWTFAIFSLAGCWFMYWTLSNLGKNLTDTVHVRSNASLITSGPYRWVRHPFYFTTAWLVTCVSIASASWIIGLFSIAVITMLVLRTNKEEEMLLSRFGDDYRRYCESTGQFLPRFSRKKLAE